MRIALIQLSVQSVLIGLFPLIEVLFGLLKFVDELSPSSLLQIQNGVIERLQPSSFSLFFGRKVEALEPADGNEVFRALIKIGQKVS